MPNLPYHKPISVALAVVLLMNGTAAHGFCHAHVGGDAAHSHGIGEPGCPSHDCHHDQRHPVCPCHASEIDAASCITAGSVAHVHLNVFGFDFSIPTPNESNGDEGESHSLAFLAVTEETAIASTGRPADVDLLQGIDSEPCRTDVVAAYDAAMQISPQVPTTPLCDSARFERTGVLLT